jgi:hypothetical protein
VSDTMLRIRVVEDLDRRQFDVLVVDPQDSVLGRLEHSVVGDGGVVWEAGGKGSVGILTVKFACERARIECRRETWK